VRLTPQTRRRSQPTHAWLTRTLRWTSNFWTRSVCQSEIASRQHGPPARMSFFGDNDLRFLDSHLDDLRFGIEIRASRGAIPLDSPQ
jgi:hypothetical protein